MSRQLRIIAADDEMPALRRLEIVLDAIPDVELVGTATSGVAALQLVKELRPDVALLDIAMPGLSGLDVAERLGDGSRPAVVFVTACDHHAVEAFERGAVDYLLKPVEVDRLASALERARHRGTLEERDAQIAEMRDVMTAVQRGMTEPLAPARRYETEFWAHRHNEFVRVPIERLVWIEAERDYVRLHQRKSSCLLHEGTAGMARRLDPALFVQIHRSVIVRASEVVAIRRGITGVMLAQLAGGRELNVGRKYAKNIATFLAKLGQLHDR